MEMRKLLALWCFHLFSIRSANSRALAFISIAPLPARNHWKLRAQLHLE